MRYTRVLFVSALALVFAVALSAQEQVPPQQTPPQTQSASGTISAVASNSFTITLQKTVATASGPSAQEDQPKSMTFLVDKNTTVDGKLAVGSNADVTYRDDSAGNHLALAVRVTPTKQ
jgi:hypothetical protein